MLGKTDMDALPEKLQRALEGDVSLMKRDSGELILGLGAPFYRHQLRAVLAKWFDVPGYLMDTAVTAVNKAIHANERRETLFWREYEEANHPDAWIRERQKSAYPPRL